MFAIIPASRTIDGRDVVVYAPVENEAALAPMVRSFLAHVRDVAYAYAAGESDALDMSGWRFPVEGSDGWVRDYTFDGVDVVRGGAYIARPVSEIRSAWAALAGIGEDDAPAATIGNQNRASVNKRDYARRTIAKAMGFSGNKAWKAAGYPVDSDKVSAETIALAEIPVPAIHSGGTSIPVLSQSVIRPTRRPGQYQGHSHNN